MQGDLGSSCFLNSGLKHGPCQSLSKPFSQLGRIKEDPSSAMSSGEPKPLTYSLFLSLPNTDIATSVDVFAVCTAFCLSYTPNMMQLGSPVLSTRLREATKACLWFKKEKKKEQTSYGTFLLSFRWALDLQHPSCEPNLKILREPHQ